MKRTHTFSLVVLAGLSFEFATLAQTDRVPLWQIGAPDGGNREFALAPNRYGNYSEPGFFLVGRSESGRDWPYVHPGPADGWAGGRPHTFTAVFGLKEAPAEADGDGECRLSLRLLDAHSAIPPRLRVRVNQHIVEHSLPAGAGDDSVYGRPDQGKPYGFQVVLPAGTLVAGENQVQITTLGGSWFLYDWVGLEGPANLELAAVAGRTFVDEISSVPVLIEAENGLQQTIRVSLRHLGEATEATVAVGDTGPRRVELRTGAQVLEVPVPAVGADTSVPVKVDVDGETLATQSVTLKPVRRWVVYLLPHSHVDIGYTHVQTEVEAAQWKYLELAIETAQRTAHYPAGSRFKWNVEVLWAVDSYLQQAPREKRRAFYDAVQAGQVGLDALYGNMLTGLCRPEELLRLLRLAPELAARTGVPVVSAMITDVPGYTWGVVPALAHTGVKYFSIGPNGGDRIGHTIAAWGDKPFWWLGPNGRDKLLVWMTGTGYYQVFQSPQRLLEYLGRLGERGYPYDFVQVRHCLGDNAAPDADFADRVKAWNETYAYPRLVIATTAEMFRDFEERYGDQLPSARGDFTPYWEDGAGSSARETALNRASADRLVQAETLYALVNPAAYPLRDFYSAWRKVVLYDEHTWGAHNSISQPDHPFVQSQWAIKQAFALDADVESRALVQAANSSRGDPATVAMPAGKAVSAGAGVGADGGASPGGSVAGPAAGDAPCNVIDVFNTTSLSIPWGLVVVPPELSTAGDTVKASPTSAAALPAQRLTSGELIFRPCWGPFTGRRFFITADPPAPSRLVGARVEGLSLTVAQSAVAPELSLRLDERTGAIASLQFDGRELVDPAAATALNEYFYLPGSDLARVERSGPVTISVKERGPLIASLVVESEAPGCRKLTREVRVHALRNYIEIVNTVDKLPVRAKEGVHFGFGFQVPGGVLRMDVPWAVVRPEADQLPGACKNWFTVQRWVNLANDRFGVTWLTPDAPLVEIGGLTANLIGSLADPRVWKDTIEPSQTLYSWAMNNHWHTNYRAEQAGPTVFRYYLRPYEVRDGLEAERFGLECSQPLLALPARGEAPRGSGLRLSNGKVLVTAFKPSDDGQALILRLFGASGQDQQTELRWADDQPRALWLSDNSERPGRKLTGAIEVPAYSIVTVRVERSL
ncbi:MAG: hypothetical protein FJ387_23245 [Verrucomicrobia bacterium]|nr:hypothetical protein [Verrucomicrobiota bacterium]